MRYPTRLIILILAMAAASIFAPPRAMAQVAPRLAFGADYTYVRSNAPPGVCGCFNLQGGNGWISLGLTNHISAVAEFSGQHNGNVNSSGTDLTLVSYLFGVRYDITRISRLRPFAQVLAGGAHSSGDFTPLATNSSSNAFALTAGGGLDFNLTRHVGIRLLQADYYYTRFTNGTNDHQNNLRISAGLFLHSGSRH